MVRYPCSDMAVLDIKCGGGYHLVIVHMVHFKNQVRFLPCVGKWIPPGHYVDVVRNPKLFLDSLFCAFVSGTFSVCTLYGFLLKCCLFTGFGKYMRSECLQFIYEQQGFYPWKTVGSCSLSEALKFSEMVVVFVLEKMNFWKRWYCSPAIAIPLLENYWMVHDITVFRRLTSV